MSTKLFIVFSRVLQAGSLFTNMVSENRQAMVTCSSVKQIVLADHYTMFSLSAQDTCFNSQRNELSWVQLNCRWKPVLKKGQKLRLLSHVGYSVDDIHGDVPNFGTGSCRSFKFPRCLGEVLPYMGYIGMCGPKGYGFSAVLVINRVSILVILVLNKVWVLYSGLEFGMLFRRSYLFIIINETINKTPSKIMFRATVSATTVINMVSNFWSDNK